MATEWLEETISILLPKLEAKGIVTAEDSVYLDIRHHSREIAHNLETKGYTQYEYIEVSKDRIYTAAIYNSGVFSYEEAVAYMDYYMEHDYK